MPPPCHRPALLTPAFCSQNAQRQPARQVAANRGTRNAATAARQRRSSARSPPSLEPVPPQRGRGRHRRCRRRQAPATPFVVIEGMRKSHRRRTRNTTTTALHAAYAYRYRRLPECAAGTPACVACRARPRRLPHQVIMPPRFSRKARHGRHNKNSQTGVTGTAPTRQSLFHRRYAIALNQNVAPPCSIDEGTAAGQKCAQQEWHAGWKRNSHNIWRLPRCRHAPFAFTPFRRHMASPSQYRDDFSQSPPPRRQPSAAAMSHSLSARRVFRRSTPQSVCEYENRDITLLPPRRFTE